ncbi:MAG TPA: 23S rRNA (uracil(1939)-C(5))-methyltransferase RlmD [Firmicutes bacterium]|nr:23S rRNA (uracil(1939)-C(5))-methyltransferase RlmD [Bacillota bacterium]
MTEPKCAVFGKCGGCFYQDKGYDAQLAIKKNTVKEEFAGKNLREPGELSVFFKNEFNYRNRMDFVFSGDGPGLRQRGMFSRIVPLQECPIASEGVNRILKDLILWFGENRDELDVFSVTENTGTLRYAVIRSCVFGGDWTVTFILNKDSENIEAHKKIIERFAEKNPSGSVLAGYVKNNTDVSVTEEYEIIRGKETLKERLGPYAFEFHSQGFFQNNPAVAMDMIQYVKESVAGGYDVIVDLFGGVGTFGIHLADKAKETVIIDSSGPGIKCAKRNIIENKIENAEAYELNAKELSFFEEKLKDKKCFFVLDPPRAGLHRKTVKFIKRVRPERMVYVSCNPRQLASDISVLKDVYDYSDPVIFDMFPQTKHIENISVLTLKKV